MSHDVFLQEMPASVAFVDLRGFSQVSQRLGPVEVGVLLTRYYNHVEEAVVAHGGRVVKFFADTVLALFPSAGGKDHAGDVLRMVAALDQSYAAWAKENARMKLPELAYAVGVSTGDVLHGDIGTDRQRAFDVLGASVTLAAKLVRLAKTRDVRHLIAAETINTAREKPACIETEGAEIGGNAERVYRLQEDEGAA